jgi:ribonuclease D
MNRAQQPQSPVLISRTPALRQLVDRLSGESILAVDTESNSLYAYRERVCLIQFSTPREDLLVDPLALEDLSPLETLFSNPRIEKVFHAAEYDLISMKRDFDFSFANLFDTMLAARILGWEEVGLGSILKAEFGVQLNKRYQRANWGRRPLPQDMLAYARLDSHYLIPLSMRLKAELKARDRWQLAQEDFNRLRYVNGRDPEDLPEIPWRIHGASDLGPRQAAVLREIAEYREQIARESDRPVFKVISDRVLLSITMASPADLNALRKLGVLSDHQLQRYGEELVRAVKRGLAAPPLQPPRAARPDEEYILRLEGLREWRKKTAQKMQVKSDVVLPRDLLNSIAARNPGNEKELADILAQVPYRLERFGGEILATLSDAPGMAGSR